MYMYIYVYIYIHTHTGLTTISNKHAHHAVIKIQRHIHTEG